MSEYEFDKWVRRFYIAFIILMAYVMFFRNWR